MVSWNFYGVSNYGISEEFPWDFCGGSMGSLWDFYDICLRFLQDFYGIPMMGFLRDFLLIIRFVLLMKENELKVN